MDDVSDLNDQPDEPEGWTVSFKASGRRIPPHYHSLLRQVIDTLSANPSAVRPLLRRHFAEIDDSFFDLLAEWVDHLRADARPEVITHLSNILAIAHREYEQYRSYFPVTDKMW